MQPKDWSVEYFLANESQCKQVLENADVLKEIPSLNSTSLDHFKNGQLVRFRGMLQDTHNPEFFFKNFQVCDKKTGEKTTRSGMFIDVAHCQAHEKILFDSPDNESEQRQTWIVISTPGLNDWAKETSTVKSTDSVIGESPSKCQNKRPLDESDEPMDTDQTKKNKVSDNVAGSSQTAENSNSSSIVSRDHILNFPIPNETGKACIVKLYEDYPYKLNQIFDLVGFLSLDPKLVEAYDSDIMGNVLERQTHHPPASVVPRLHAIKVTEVDNDIPEASDILSKAKSIRGDLRIVLSQLLFGDETAADYLICHLISSVYLRSSVLCLGAFSLNISNFPKEYSNFTKDLYEILKQIISKSHLIELTLENLNEMCLVPKKDYECDRLTSGILQLSKNTHLVIDETCLSAGEVTACGRQNYQVLKDVMEFQKLSYDFKFFSTEFETDMPVLILSEVKSFIPCQTRIAIQPDPEIVKIYPEVIEAAKQYLSDEKRLGNIRQYINVLKNTEFNFTDDISETIEEDFVKIRQTDPKFSAENLHSLMVFSRLMSLSYGETTLTKEMWNKSIELETERTRRIKK